jgi:hypothetical protein
VQGGKDGVIRLLSLRQLNGHTSHPGGRQGGELQRLTGHGIRFTAPAVWRTHGRVFMFTAGGGGTQAYELRGRPPRLHLLWANGSPGSSPVLAGGLLFVYDVQGGGLNVYRAGSSSRRLARLPSGSGHWNSPVIAGGRILLPEGDANEHSGSGVLDLYAP